MKTEVRAETAERGTQLTDKLVCTAKQAEGIWVLSKHHHFPKIVSPCLRITCEKWEILICLLILSQPPWVTLNKLLTARRGKRVWHLSKRVLWALILGSGPLWGVQQRWAL